MRPLRFAGPIACEVGHPVASIAGVSTGLPAPHRPLPIRLLNGTGRAWRRLGIESRGLSEERVLERARKATGLDDFGDPHFREPLRMLLASLEREAKLSALGRIFARRQLQELLVGRLQLIEHAKRYPEVADEKIEAPLFVLGLPRTGTTLLHGLLAQDPAHRAPISWELDDPGVPARPETFERDPRIARTARRFAQLNQLAPGFQTVHPIGATLPQECIVITAFDFWGVRFEMAFDIPSYQRWMVDADPAPAYRFHRRMLQHLQSGGVRGRWVLKTPGHLGTLDALLGEYPDARIVQLHRDPVRIVPSVASLEYNLRTIATDDQDTAALGDNMLWLWSLYLERALETRDAHPEKSGQFADFHYRELVADPLGCVGRLYDRFGMELSEEAERRMRSYLAENPQHKHGRHRYSLEMFGLDEEQVADAFASYCKRFGVEREAP